MGITIQIQKFLGMTWDGHEFLDALSNQTVFEQFKTELKKVKSMPFKVAFEVLLKLSSKHILGDI